MERIKAEYSVSEVGHVKHSRIALMHSIQMILYGFIPPVEYYSVGTT